MIAVHKLISIDRNENPNFSKLKQDYLECSSNLPGAIGVKSDLFSVCDGSFTDGYSSQSISAELLLSCSSSFSQIRVDLQNDVFSIGLDAIIGVYDLSQTPKDEISTAKSKILIEEIKRLHAANKDGFYDENAVIGIIEQEFPMYTTEDSDIATSTHVVVIKG